MMKIRLKAISMGILMMATAANFSFSQTHYDGQKYFNPFPGFKKRTFGDLLKWMVWDRLTGKRAIVRSQNHNFEVVKDHRLLKQNANEPLVAWIGHSTLFLRLDGVNILTDPIFSERCSPFQAVGPKRIVPPGIALDSLPEIDLVLISHDHYDHLDKNTILRLGNKPFYLAPAGVGEILRSWGITNFAELDWWEEIGFDQLKIVCTPAQHFSGRNPFQQNKTLWAGWLIQSRTLNVYYAGDTGYFPGFAEIKRRYAPIHVAALPIGAYQPRWFMKPVHMDPPEAVKAFQELKAEVFIPIHWGAFKLADEPMDEPPGVLKESAEKSGLQPDRLWILKHGEVRSLKKIAQKIEAAGQGRASLTQKR
ncbi:MBL fold metallo-hydrolase [Calditrichota bacterium LG25]